MQPDALCQKIGQWFQKHSGENPFSFGEVHLFTGEPGADVLIVIGKLARETPDRHAYETQWENTTYDHPVTWLWQKLADEEADTWLRLIYEETFHDQKKAMLTALYTLANLIESQGYTLNWEAEEDDTFLTEIAINRVEEKVTHETDRWQALLQQHGGHSNTADTQTRRTLKHGGRSNTADTQTRMTLNNHTANGCPHRCC